MGKLYLNPYEKIENSFPNGSPELIKELYEVFERAKAILKTESTYYKLQYSFINFRFGFYYSKYSKNSSIDDNSFTKELNAYYRSILRSLYQIIEDVRDYGVYNVMTKNPDLHFEAFPHKFPHHDTYHKKELLGVDPTNIINDKPMNDVIFLRPDRIDFEPGFVTTFKDGIKTTKERLLTSERQVELFCAATRLGTPSFYYFDYFVTCSTYLMNYVVAESQEERDKLTDDDKIRRLIFIYSTINNTFLAYKEKTNKKFREDILAEYGDMLPKRLFKYKPNESGVCRAITPLQKALVCRQEKSVFYTRIIYTYLGKVGFGALGDINKFLEGVNKELEKSRLAPITLRTLRSRLNEEIVPTFGYSIGKLVVKNYNDLYAYHVLMSLDPRKGINQNIKDSKLGISRTTYFSYLKKTGLNYEELSDLIIKKQSKNSIVVKISINQFKAKPVDLLNMNFYSEALIPYININKLLAYPPPDPFEIGARILKRNKREAG